MPPDEYFLLMGMGGLFILLGIGAIIWGTREEKGYYNSLSSRKDIREYIEHSPQRPEHEALKIGGWIAIATGLITLAIGGGFWYWG